MAEPSISEIVGRPDAELGTGQPAAALDISSGLNAATLAARDYSQNLVNKYALFQRTLGQFAQNHQLDFAGVMQEDLPTLKKKATEYFAKVQSNPKLVQGIGQDADWIDLQTSIQKSKQDNSYLSAQNEFRRAHPDLYNQNNDQIEGQFRGTPLETRSAFNWDLPKTIDFTTLGQTTLGTGQAFSVQNANPKDENGLPIKGYFLETKGKKYDLDQYKDKVDALYNSDYKIDSYGHTIKQYADDHYNLLPSNLKQQYEQLGKQQGIDGQEAWFQDQMLRQYKPFDVTDTQLVEDKYGLEKQKNAVDWAKLDLDRAKFNKENQEDQTGAGSVLNEALSIIGKGTPVTVYDYDKLGAGHNKEMLEIADPTLLNSFGKIDKEGNVTNVPDNVYYDKNNGQLNLIYYKHKTTANQITGKEEETQEIETTASGKRVVDRQVPLDERTWTKEITKRSFPNKDIGGVNSIVDDVLNKNGNSLYNVYQKLGGGKQSEQNTTSDLPATNGKVDKSKLHTGSSYNYNGKTYKWDGTNLIPQ